MTGDDATAAGAESAAVTETTTRVLVIDDDEHLRAALREVLAGQTDLDYVGFAATADSAVAACLEHRPDVALVDSRLPGGGASAARQVAARCPDVALVALSGFSDRRHRDLMLAAGASRYVAKGAPSHELLRAIREARAGGAGSQG